METDDACDQSYIQGVKHVRLVAMKISYNQPWDKIYDANLVLLLALDKYRALIGEANSEQHA